MCDSRTTNLTIVARFVARVFFVKKVRARQLNFTMSQLTIYHPREKCNHFTFSYPIVRLQRSSFQVSVTKSQSKQTLTQLYLLYTSKT